MAAKKKEPKPKKAKVTDASAFEACPTYHLLTKQDRVCKMGNTTWSFTPDQFVGMRAKHVFDGGYRIQKSKG